MNILIIGNGFDIAHGLPTTYKDFLKFINQINRVTNYHGTVKNFESPTEQTGYDEFNKLHKGVAQYIDKIIRDDDHPNASVKDIYIKHPNKIINEIIKLSEGNIWINWFNNSDTLLKEGWIDFESEISRVVQNFESISKEVASKKIDINILSNDNEKIINLFTKGKRTITDLTAFDFNTYKDKMIEDLNSLIRCLELYLEDCVRNIDKSLLSPDIANLKVDKVLSFNYTDTYNRLYSSKNRNIEYDYIHGKSKLENDSANNMVLGIDEYLQDNERNTNVDYIEFKKYYQRIHKKTGCVYKNWLGQIDESKSDVNNVYIFGHSLAVTDKDVLKEILTNKKVKTTIYYHDSKSYGEQIAHLVQVLGQDSLISMVYCYNPRIKFELQKAMIDRNGSEWQMRKDTYALWYLYLFSDNEIEEIIKRITEKIENKDLEYFCDQKNVISLYDALVNNLDFKKSDDLLQIAESLYNSKACNWYDSEDWNDCNYAGEIPCDNRVCKFINEINEYNMDQKIDSEFKVNDLNVLYEQISESTIEEERCFKLVDALISMFENREPNIESIWKCIFLLSNKISPDRWKAFIKKKLSASTGIKKMRFSHIQDAIDENNFYEYINQNIEE